MFIAEPTTTLTDYLMALESAAFAFVLWRLRPRAAAPDRPRLYLFTAGFTLAAIASVLGGTAHGFRQPLGDAWATVWSATVGAIVTAFAVLLGAGAWSAASPRTSRPKRIRQGRRWLARGYAITVAGLAVLTAKVSLHAHLNQNDLYHLFQMAGLYGVYRGGSLLTFSEPAD